MRSILQSVTVLMLMIGLVGCGAAAGTQEPPAQTGSLAGSPTATAAVAVSGLQGQVFSASDVSNRPDTPLSDQLVLAVPADRAGDILGPGSEHLDEQQLRFLSANIPAAIPEVVTTLSDGLGNFTLILPPGEYLLCVADSDTNPPSFPAVTRGCGRVNVLAGELHPVNISSGFGEILLEEP